MKSLTSLFLKFDLSLFFISAFLILPSIVQAAEDANQIQASSLLRTPASKSVNLENMILDGEKNTANLELERFEVFAADAQITIHDAQGLKKIQPPPSSAYFKGYIVGDPNSLVVLSADPSGAMRGIAQRENKLWILAGGASVSGPSLGLVSQEVAQSGRMHSAAPFQCGVESKTQELTAPPLPKIDNLPVEPLSPGQFYQIRVAIETDGEFYNLFGNSNSALNYIGDLLAYSSVIYNREIGARLIVGSVSLWSGGPTTDPWDHINTLNGLLNFQDYWNTNRIAVSRTIAHFLSGRNLGGGIAYVGALCNTSYGYGYSANIDGQFQIGNPQPVWDAIVVSHEIGHNFSSPHTHCYGGIDGNNNPVDACYNAQQGPGCWGGAISLPGVNSLTGGTSGSGSGTIMSYCHLFYPGNSNISLTFGKNHSYGIQASRVSTKMASYVASIASNYPNCITVGSAQTYTVSLNTVGTGSGAVSGAGNYTAGTMVNLNATPSAGSTFVGWNPSPCAASFPMPASDLTCTATFNANVTAGSDVKLAGLTTAGQIYYTANFINWNLIPGALSQLVISNFDSDGKANDLAGVAGDGTVWYTTNRSTWAQIPGRLSRLVAGDFDSDGTADDLAGVAGDGTVWYTTNRSTWAQIPGRLLNQLAGDD